VVFHGGEPLLAGVDTLADLAGAWDAACSPILATVAARTCGVMAAGRVRHDWSARKYT
jgi:hypothetical protein